MKPSNVNTRQKLQNVAHDLIQKRGVNGFSFQDLSDAVGIRKASVHHHFPSKADLIESLMQHFLEDLDECTRTIMSSNANAKTKLKRFCALFSRTLQDGQNDKCCLCGMLLAEIASLEKPVVAKLKQFVQNNLSVIEEIVREGANDGTLAVQSNPKSTALLILAALEGGLLVARCDQGPRQFAELVNRLISLLSAR